MSEPRSRSTRPHSSVAQPRNGWEAIVELALAEDIGAGDVTSLATVEAETQASGTIVAKAEGVISGLEIARYVFWRVDPAIVFDPAVVDGERVAVGALIASVGGPARAILAGERLALNLLQRLSGVATLTATYVERIAGTRARIVDTRKTTPGLRALEKAAVRHGGGRNHRFGLADGILIKDNHLAAVGGADRIGEAVRRARDWAPHSLRIEVEVTSPEEAAEAAAAGADVILLDNMNPASLRASVEAIAGRAIVEASGGVTLLMVREIAETGVDLISVGALTHSAVALDLSLNLETNPGPPRR